MYAKSGAYIQYSERYAKGLLRKEGRVVEGNERLEFLGDALLYSLTTLALMKHYQINEGGMTVSPGAFTVTCSSNRKVRPYALH